MNLKEMVKLIIAVEFLTLIIDLVLGFVYSAIGEPFYWIVLPISMAIVLACCLFSYAFVPLLIWWMSE